MQVPGIEAPPFAPEGRGASTCRQGRVGLPRLGVARLVRLASGLAVAGLLTGCFVAPLVAGAGLAIAYPPQPRRNVVTDKVDDDHARVRAADYDFAVGDRVQLLRTYCYRARRSTFQDCFDDPVSGGTVVAIAGDHLLDVHFEPGADFRKGDIVTTPARVAP